MTFHLSQMAAGLCCWPLFPHLCPDGSWTQQHTGKSRNLLLHWSFPEFLWPRKPLTVSFPLFSYRLRHSRGKHTSQRPFWAMIPTRLLREHPTTLIGSSSMILRNIIIFIVDNIKACYYKVKNLQRGILIYLPSQSLWAPARRIAWAGIKTLICLKIPENNPRFFRFIGLAVCFSYKPALFSFNTR